MMSFSRRWRIRVLSGAIALVAVLVGLAWAGHARAESYRRLLANSGQHAFLELVSASDDLTAALRKAVYSNCAHDLGGLYSQIYAKALTAQLAISELPYGGAELEQTSSFFARTGDFAASLSRSGAVCSEEERQLLRQLLTVSAGVSDTLQALQTDLLTGTRRLEDVFAATARLAAKAEDETGGDAVFQAVESAFPELPMLIYDGPFSDHLTNREPRGLAGMEDVSRDEARANAAGFLGVRPEVLSFCSDGGGVLPTYSFSATVDGGEVYLEVTRVGGQVINYLNSRTVGSAALTPEQAIQLAKNHLAAWGYPLMRESYYINDFNILTINFAAVQDDVYCYPDLVEVSIALDNGRVVGFRGEGYWMHHVRRDLPEPTLTRADAEAKLLPELAVLAWQLALIPSPGEYETLCHEFKCMTPENTHILVYINAETGVEEQILLLIEDETGTLVV